VSPVISLSGAQTTNEDTNLVFSTADGNAITISEADAGAGTPEVTLTVTDGTLTLGGTAGLTFASGDGAADTTMTFRGTVAAINAALNGLTYTPTSNYNGGSTLTLSSLDSTLVSLNIDAYLHSRYIFEGNANDVAPGTTQNGTLTNGASTVSDVTRGQVLNLDGTDDYVDLSSSVASLAGLTYGTIAGWIKVNGTFETIFSISDTADPGSYVALFLGASGYLTFEVLENGVAQLAVYRSSAAINDGNWHHVAVTVGATGNRLYVDGVQASAGQLTYNTGNASTLPDFSYVTSLDAMAIGRTVDSGGGKWHATGRLDEVRLYSRALTGGEVLTLANDLNLSDTDTVAITVSPINDEPTLTATGTNPTFTEGGSAVDLFGTVSASTVEAGQTLTRLDFTVSNVTDGSAEQITVDGTTIQLVNGGSGTTATNAMSYTVSVASGTATVSLTKGAGITTAQMQTLVEGMTYQNTSQDPTAANRVVTLTRLDDNGSNSAPNDNTATLAITPTVSVNAVNDEQVLATNTGLTVAENSSGTLISNTMLASTDVDHGPAQLVYTLSAVPANGTLRLNGTALGVSDTFTQDDLDNNRIRYDHNGSETSSDSFAFSVDDGSGTTTAGSFTITVTPVNDNAPVISSSASVSMAEGAPRCSASLRQMPMYRRAHPATALWRAPTRGCSASTPAAGR